jgi:DNA modification methylase
LAAKKLAFLCSQCGVSAEAPVGTERYEKLLCKDCYGKREDKRPRALNELSGSEWAKFSKSVEQYPDTRSKKQKLHGASFPMSLAKQQIEIYTKKGELVFDPFLGVGTTIDAALELGRKAIGIELNPKFAQLAQEDIDNSIFRDNASVIVDDTNNMLNYLSEESVDFILTSPPYADLLRNVKGAFAYKWREHSDVDPVENPQPYSDLPNDIGNMTYEESLSALQEVFRKCYIVQKNESYAVWVVKDFRNVKKNIPYINFHGDVIRLAEESGYFLWDIRIYDQTQFRPLVCLGYPSRNYYLNIGHSYILVFKKTTKAKRRRV